MTELYTNPRGLYGFQAELVARSYYRRGNLAVVDTGLGKSHIAMALAALMMKDGMVDKVILVAEGNKLDEWRDDLAAFTTMSLNVFHGPKRRIDDADVLLSTYSTLRDAMATAHPSDNRLMSAGALTQHFTGKRLLVIYDEMALLGTSRTSKTFRAHRLALEAWRATGADVRVLGLTATPMSTTPECYYNLGLLLAPESTGTFVQWCNDFVVGYDRWQKPNQFMHLDVFERRLSTFMLRKRKTDADVKDQFPRLVEKAVYLTMPKAHRDAYDNLEAFLETVPDKKMLPAFRAINAFAAHPRSILSANWDVAQEWLDRYGRDKVSKIPAVKAQAIIGQLRSIDAQDDGGVIVFSHSVNALMALADDLRSLPATEVVNFVEFHGRQSDAKNAAAKASFKDGIVRVMLASSKAERGINLPEAHYIINLDVPTTHSSYIQRYNRGSRIGSNVDGSLLVKTYITRGTIERATVNLWLKRNEWSDQLQDPRAGEDFTSALQRRMMVRMAGSSFDEDPSDIG